MYVDPGAGSLIIQVFIASAVAMAASLRRVRLFFAGVVQRWRER